MLNKYTNGWYNYDFIERISRRFVEIKTKILTEKKASSRRLLQKIMYSALCRLHDAYTLFCFTEALEFYNTGSKRKKRVIAANTNIDTGMKFCSSLTYKNISCEYELTTEAFHSEALSITIAAVPRTSTAFFMSHTTSPV